MLELSKLHTYDFHYNHVCVKYAIVLANCDNYRVMADDVASRYDFGEYPLNHPLHDASNRKALRFFR